MRQDPLLSLHPKTPGKCVCRDLSDGHPFHRTLSQGRPTPAQRKSFSSCFWGEQLGCQAQVPQRHGALAGPEDKQS